MVAHRPIEALQALGLDVWLPYIASHVCGRVVQASEPLRYAFVDGLSVPDSRARPPSYNVAPSQELYAIRHNHKTGERTLDLLRWGLIPHGCKDPSGNRVAQLRRNYVGSKRQFASPLLSLPQSRAYSGDQPDSVSGLEVVCQLFDTYLRPCSP
jgi:hypothetical protein